MAPEIPDLITVFAAPSNEQAYAECILFEM